MAEGGFLPDKHVNYDNILLECPICLEQMQKPKSLPCLHSFCEECLSTYIVTDLSGEMAAVTSFPCPVCRQITSPVNHSESKEMWAQQFPTNSMVKESTSRTKESDAPLNCGPCKKTKNMETPATTLCKTNGMLFCDHCKVNVHDILHEICDIVTLNEAHHDVTWKRTSSRTCSKHKEKMDCYCEDHKFIGCNKCIITNHRRCDEVHTIKKYCEKQKDNSRLDDIDNSLEKAANVMELLLNAFDQEVESLQRCQDVGLSSISDLRQRINTYLDKKQEEITQEMISNCKAEKAKVDLSKQKCSRLRAAIQNTKEASRTALRTDDNFEMIQLFLRGQTEIRACNDLIDDITHSSKSVSIKHDIDRTHTTIDKASALTLGRILVKENSCIKPDGVEYIPNVGILSKCRVRKIRTCNIRLPSRTEKCSPRGVLLMPNDHIIISDHSNGKIKMFSEEENCLDELKIGGYLRDICIVNNNTVAAASFSGEQGRIQIVEIISSKLSLSSSITISGNTDCHGIAFFDGAFIVSTPKDIRSVTLKGKTMVSCGLGAECCHLAYCPKQKKVFASLNTSTWGAVALTRLSAWIKTDMLISGVVKNAMGVDLDREGNVYVCGQASNNVVQISSDGSKVRELLTSKDGIDKPRAISVCGDKLAITNESFTQNDQIHVYQLY
ncbi:uncharacterized protein LOC110451323 [Mizuhopecten yessoensis]|uniref:uncharacterized protein LOC110451323 n=1 Tax=Mizuhopecten yessoensis TaxID=6573 RepID=UPI000B45A472|nr:uncharacterized protein LOC110451323 [Mizuhopecten yessoensis]